LLQKITTFLVFFFPFFCVRPRRALTAQSRQTLDCRATSTSAVNRSTREDGDHIGAVEHDIEIEEADAPRSSRGPHNAQPNGKASKPSQSCSTDTGRLSEVQEQRESSDDAERQESIGVENMKHGKEAKSSLKGGKDTKGNKSASFSTDTTVSFPEENVAEESTGDANNGAKVQQSKKNPDGDLSNEEHHHQDVCI